MLEKYREAITSFSPGVSRAVGIIFDLPGRADLYDELEDAGWTQADLAVELLRLDLIPEVEVLIGHPITHCPGFTHVRPYPKAEPPGPDDRRVKSVVRNPRLPTTDSFFRFQHIKVGASVASLLRRGVTRRDIREALSNGWMELT